LGIRRTENPEIEKNKHALAAETNIPRCDQGTLLE